MSGEFVRHRLAAAIRFVDAATGLLVRSPVRVYGDGLAIIRNRRGYYTVLAGVGDMAPIADVELQIAAADGQYLPRRVVLPLPRDPDPANVANEDSLFRSVDVALFRAPAAASQPNWAVVRASVVNADGEPWPAAFLQVLRTIDGSASTLAQGFTDWRGRVRGEAVIGVPGIPVAISNDGNGNGDEDEDPVMVPEVPVTLDVVVDPLFDPDAGVIPNPQVIEENRETLPSASFDMRLVRGQTLTRTLIITDP
jgi:hypothetical protein